MTCSHRYIYISSNPSFQNHSHISPENTQAKSIQEIQARELTALRRNFRMHLRSSPESSLEAEAARQRLREAQRAHARKREAKRALLMQELSGRAELVEAELKDLGLTAPDPKARIRDEEEMIMSYLLTQVEMEAALSGDYASVMDATKTLARDVSGDVAKFDEQERGSTTPEGSLFKKHRQTVSRHSGALNVTLANVRKKLKEGYASLNAKIDALDFDVVSVSSPLPTISPS